MSILYERIDELCSERGITGYRLSKDLGLSPNIITELRLGRREGVSAKTAEKIASYFGVSVGYLLGTEQKEKPAETGELAEYLEDLRSRPETRALLEASRGMTREQVEKMAEFAKMLRGGGNGSD